MQQSTVKTDRYVSFEGIECDACARRLVAHIRDCIEDVGRPSPWQSYFQVKLAEVARRGQDELYFVGSQVNAIRELFAHDEHGEALELLDWIEEECC